MKSFTAFREKIFVDLLDRSQNRHVDNFVHKIIYIAFNLLSCFRHPRCRCFHAVKQSDP